MRIKDTPERPPLHRPPLTGVAGEVYYLTLTELIRNLLGEEEIKGRVPLQHKEMYSVTPLPQRAAKPPLPTGDTMGVTRPNPPPRSAHQEASVPADAAFLARSIEAWQGPPRRSPLTVLPLGTNDSIELSKAQPPPSGFIEVRGAHGIRTLIPHGTPAIQLESILKEIEAQAPSQDVPQHYQEAKKKVWEENEFWSKGWRGYVRKEERWILEGTKYVHDS